MYTSKGLVPVLIVVIVFITLSCDAGEKAPPPVATPMPEVKLPARGGWEQKWETTVSDAKKEGKVIVHAGGGVSIIKEMVVSTVKKKYGIDVELLVAPGQMLAERVIRERRAGVYNVDLVWTGANSAFQIYHPAGVLDKLEPALILPEVIDPNAWFWGHLGWINEEHTILGFSAGLQPMVLFNTTLSSAEEIKSIYDLLKPKWKGKIITVNPTVTGSAQNAMMALGTLPQGWDSLQELLKQEPKIVGDSRQMTEWIVQGKYQLGLGVVPADVRYFQEAGAPLALTVPLDSAMISTWASSLVLIKDAPHPSAAKVFINWLLTRETQLLITRPYNTPSARADVPNKELVDPVLVPDRSVKYRNMDAPEFINRRTEYARKVNEIFQPYLR